MKNNGNWITKCASSLGFMTAVPALALVWATGAAAAQAGLKTGQTACYQLERYPVTANAFVFEGEAIVRDAEGDAEFDTVTGAANPNFDPGSGQVSDLVIDCAGTGQDGEFQMGAALRYKDKGDGTILDRNTGLQWAKKSDDDGIHDKDNTYTWEEALAYVKELNNVCQRDNAVACTTNADCAAGPSSSSTSGKLGGKCGFAGKRDWRLPNVRELGTLVNFGVFSDGVNPAPTVSPEFNTNCVPGVTIKQGSCTHADNIDLEENFVPFGAGARVPFTYWSSTTGDIPGDAWFVDYFTGDSGAHFKDVDIDIDTSVCPLVGDVNVCSLPDFPPDVAFAGHVRAVRAGESDD
jgi:Protein of unknown function (DUF1566)